MNKIIVYIESIDENITKSSLEVLGTALDLSIELGRSVEAYVFGNNFRLNENLHLESLEKVTHFKSGSKYLDNSTIAQIIQENTADTNTYYFFPNSSYGKDIAASLSAKLNIGIIADCVSITSEDGNVIVTRPIYAGKVLNKIFISEPKILTLRANNFSPSYKSGDAHELIEKNIDSIDSNFDFIELIKDSAKLDVKEAEIIVSGGRGLKDPVNFKLIEELAEELNAAVGASRAVVDAGWRPHEEQIGQTGKTVSPTLYIAVGISGAIQHLAGMNTSKYIVAINKDKDAPIFKVADYGIIGDAMEVLPKLITELKTLKS